MLLVVLLSAAPTGGQVRSRLVGSAFDPASVSVALYPKQPKAKAVAKVANGGLPASEADGPPLHPGTAGVLQPLPALHLDRAPLPAPLPVTLARAGLSPKAHGARAPPLG